MNLPYIKKVDNFFSKVENSSWLLNVFDGLPDTLFYIKDKKSRWITCNEASLRFLNFSSKEDVFGIIEADFFPQVLADTIRQDDINVIQNNQEITDRAELIIDKMAVPTWVVTNKKPLLDSSGDVIGLVGTTRLLHNLDSLSDEYQPFTEVMAYIQKNIGASIQLEELAKIMKLSISQFRKKFKLTFNLSPQEFILRTRLKRAARLLSETEQPLIKIAIQCGYCDQSYFTKQFSDFYGNTPKQYRKTWKKPSK